MSDFARLDVADVRFCEIGRVGCMIDLIDQTSGDGVLLLLLRLTINKHTQKNLPLPLALRKQQL